jgi:hypothetical protein
MDSLEESVRDGVRRSGFIDYVFKMDDAQQGVLLNITQYIVLALVPIAIVLSVIRTYSPDPDDQKGSLMVLVEIVGQLLFMFASIYFIHRTITYVPTYSGYKYGELNMVTIALGILMIVLSIKTKLGEKVQILVDRVEDLWSGQGSAREGYGQQSQVRVTQPLSNQYAQSSGGMMVTGGIAPPPAQLTSNKSMQNEFRPPAQQQPSAPAAGASPYGGTMGGFEPMAANEIIGHSMF